MQSNVVSLPLTEFKLNKIIEQQAQVFKYDEAEQQFITLLYLENLDKKLAAQPEISVNFERAIAHAIEIAYKGESGDNDAAHLFLQRVLYRINRINLFWYDDLRHYTNERSYYLQKIRNQIEEVWQQWEISQIDVEALQKLDAQQALIERGERDLDPYLSKDGRYIREEMTEAGYRHLLAIASFDGLVEASRLSRILGGAANEVQCTLVRVLLEEYGNGRLSRKHSTFFAQMLAEFGMNTEPEGYFDIVPWEVLASINHNFLLTECKRYFLRYNGGLTYFEIVGPSIYKNYLTAAQRLKLSDAAMGYWELHIREDERHGRWMLDDVALPLVDMYPDEAWQIVLGYDQEKFMADRAGAAMVRSIRSIC
ncbi:iron-containing redox enzyme family protein [Aerosakkonema funiforme]|uniref:Iron-containing redox enzyme family protein n=1 Tax=Aerosakkonema funiforme FACHB-1375 TaxID=2949571 RepID=A0A926VKL2_9CYAN|nr:iron-containing redox enzyme family protein [Aerosakkonema funiforme]MBD2185428.1 iron-containing redox enzyme family protein [Aerosakkonema funiforme FACHB-1375]